MCNRCYLQTINTKDKWHKVAIGWAFFARIKWHKKRFGSLKHKDRKGYTARYRINRDIIKLKTGR